MLPRTGHAASMFSKAFSHDGYSNNLSNLIFYLIDKRQDPNKNKPTLGPFPSGSLNRKVFMKLKVMWY